MEKFEKVKSLGRGSQGTVILVKRKADKSKFVIKQIFVDDQTPEEREEVMNEIRVLAMLAHPNVVAYYGSFVEDNLLNVVMEYADNGSLHQYIQKCKQPLPEKEVLDIFAQLLLALDHLHDKKTLHRDLKTKNIFITKQLKVKLGDFGLSKMLDATSFAQSAVGTPYYLSPELCEGKRYNHKSDVWALGCVLYELTTFKHAFDATNLPALVLNIIQGTYNPIPDTYSPELQEALRVCLAKNPEDRPDMKDLLDLPIISDHVRALQGETQEQIQQVLQMPRPFFETGQVETVATRARGGAKMGLTGGSMQFNRQDSGSTDNEVSTDSILREVEEEQQFERLVQSMRSSINVTDRIHNRVPFFKCFSGLDMVNFLVSNVGLDGRVEAIHAAQRWMDAGVFYHVTRTDLMQDSPNALYRFKEDEVGSILNMKTLWTAPPRPAIQVEEDFRRQLELIFNRYSDTPTRLIDYEGLALNDEFKGFIAASAELQKFDLSAVSFNVKIAFFINLFNALVIHGFVTIGPPTNLYQRLYFYNHTCYSIGGMVYSLCDIENGILRGNHKPYMAYRRVFHPNDPRLQSAVVVWDPRIHFALVRGTKSCPRVQVYDPDRLDEMLNAATREYCSANVELVVVMMDGMAKTQVELPAIFEWYSEDFGTTEGEMLHWVAGYLSSSKMKALYQAIDTETYVIKYFPFDWTLNKRQRSTPPVAAVPIHNVPPPPPPSVPLPPAPAATRSVRPSLAKQRSGPNPIGG